MPSNAEIVREACQVVWTEGRADRVAEFYAEDFVADYPMTQWGTGLDGVRALVADVRVGLPDYREEIKLLIDGGEYIVVELLIHGTHTGPMGGLPPSGKSVSFRDVTILRLRDGKIIEQRGLTDHLSLFQQLGVQQIPGAAADTAHG
ncbi:MAG: ester cyclase [Pseudomonadota bacterium]